MARIGWAALCVTVFAIVTFLVIHQATHKRGAVALSTVKVLAAEGHGSGVHTGSRFVFTAAHVVKDAREVKLKTSLGVEVPADVLWVNEAHDIALLRARELPSVAVSRLSCRDPSIGQSIIAVGNPGPLEFITSFGRVSSDLRHGDRWADYYIAAISIAPGMSGGPVVNEQGQVVGIVVGVALTPMGWSASLVSLAYIVPSRTVCQMLARGDD